MITVGLIKELYYISKVCGNLSLSIHSGNGLNEEAFKRLGLSLTREGQLDIWYMGNHIWNETVEGPSSMFGVESCDNISRIINCINAGDQTWKEKYYYSENSLDKTKT